MAGASSVSELEPLLLAVCSPLDGVTSIAGSGVPSGSETVLVLAKALGL